MPKIWRLAGKNMPRESQRCGCASSMLPPPKLGPRIPLARQNPRHCSHRPEGCKRMLVSAPPRNRARALPRRRTASLDRSVERQAVDHLVELGLGCLMLFFQVGRFALQSLQAVFLIVELLGIALRQRALLGTSFERLQVFADALLVVVDRFRFVVAFRGFVLERSDFSLLLDDFSQRGFDIGIDRFLANEELELIFVDTSDLVIRRDGL